MIAEAAKILQNRKTEREIQLAKETYSGGKRISKNNHPGNIYWPTAMRIKRNKTVDAILEGTVGRV